MGVIAAVRNALRERESLFTGILRSGYLWWQSWSMWRLLHALESPIRNPSSNAAYVRSCPPPTRIDIQTNAYTINLEQHYTTTQADPGRGADHDKLLPSV
jgi:hypothetical protein